MLDRASYLRRWSELHGGVDPAASPVIGRWLTLSYAAARPLAARRVPPDAVTVAGLVVSLLVVPLAAAGGRWPLLAVPVVVLSGLIDNLDGAVAVLTERVTRWGSVLDSLADRCSDLAYVGALLALAGTGRGWVLGCAAGSASLVLLQEYVRARATVSGMDDVGVVTVSERPTRVIGAAMFCLGAGLNPASAATWGAVGLAFGVAAGLAGLTQLLVVAHRRLR